jgi:orotate phosphoribosyltransferase
MFDLGSVLALEGCFIPIFKKHLRKLWRLIMENKAYKVSLAKNSKISIKVIPGHFATNSAHISHYLDVSTLKSNASIAQDVARELALPYLSSSPIDTIVCMENTKVIGAFLALELSQLGMAVINSGCEINVLTPMSNTNGKLIFFESEIGWITGRNILLLVATISSGRTVRSALECIEYYGGKLAGISALFLASSEKLNMESHALFTSEDIENYKVYKPSECEMCKAGEKVEVIISSEGYTKILN